MLDGTIGSIGSRTAITREYAKEKEQYWKWVAEIFEKCEKIGIEGAANDQEKICIAYVLSSGSERETARILGMKMVLKDSSKWYPIFIKTIFSKTSKEHREAKENVDSDILYLAREIGIQRNWSPKEKAGIRD